MTAEIANLGVDSMTILGYAWTMDYPTDSSAVWTNATPDANGNYYLGSGFGSNTLPSLNTVMAGSQSQIVDLLFNATTGTGEYLSYFQVYTNGGASFVVLEGSASTAPIANFSISTPEGGWLASTDLNPIMDFGPVMPGNTSSLVIRICNQGGSVLEVTKSKPPSGVIRAAYPGVDLAEGSTIPVGACATGTVLFEPNEEQVNIPDFVEENTWTLNTDDLTFGVHVVNITGTVHDRQVGLIYPNNQSAQYLYLGCYQDGNPRLLPGEPYNPGLQENGRCIEACYAAGYIFAGTEFQDECWCGNSAPPGYLYYPESDDLCTYTCTNDTSQACGGNGGYISVFYDQSRFVPNNQTYNTTKPAPPSTVTSIGNYTWVGCYSEGTGGRALTSKNVAAPSAGGSVEYCASACAGYAYFGVEYYNECYCGNSISNGAGLISNNASSAAASVSGCNYLCGGNPSEYCGGASKLDIYYTNVTGVSPPSATTASTSQDSATTTAAGGPTYVPYVNTTSGVWNLIGCYTEATVGRALTSKSYSNTSNTVELCAAFCSGYTFFGVEW
jgi:iron transport multicopper oxidase